MQNLLTKLNLELTYVMILGMYCITDSMWETETSRWDHGIKFMFTIA